MGTAYNNESFFDDEIDSGHSHNPFDILRHRNYDYDSTSLHTEATFDSEFVAEGIKEYERRRDAAIELADEAIACSPPTVIHYHMQFEKVDRLVFMRGTFNHLLKSFK